MLFSEYTLSFIENFLINLISMNCEISPVASTHLNIYTDIFLDILRKVFVRIVKT